jgi:hypothetical protein
MNLSQIDIEKPLTFLCHDGSVDVVNDRPDVMTIDPMATLECARNITPTEWDGLKKSSSFMHLFRLVFTDLDLPDGHTLQMHGNGVKHIVGLLILTMQALLNGKTPYWQHPESFLHPRNQLGLADLAAYLANKPNHETE